MKTDYSKEIKQLLEGNYEPVESLAHERPGTEKKTLTEVYKEITGILPSKWIHESDVYEALQELGFKSFFYISSGPESGEEVIQKKKAGYFMNPIL